MEVNGNGKVFKWIQRVRSRSITLGTRTTILYSEWNDMIQNSFEKYFYIPTDALKDKDYQIEPFTHLVQRRGIYKDTFNLEAQSADYQLRPNIGIACSVVIFKQLMKRHPSYFITKRLF